MSNLDWLDGLKPRGVRLGLPPVRRLCEALGNPQDAVPSILVAGTNGKGSICAMIEAGLRAAGFRTGLFTSPHLFHLSERYRLGGEDVSVDLLEEVLGTVREVAEGLTDRPTYFEVTTAAAFVLFAQQECDYMVLEVGMGGRLDATNVVQAPLLSVISRVDLDHTAELGPDLATIAKEKAGIFRHDGRCVLAPQHPDAMAALMEEADHIETQVFLPARHGHVEVRPTTGGRVSIRTSWIEETEIQPALLGSHQHDNIATAIQALELLAEYRPGHSPSSILAGIETCRLPGRLEWRPGAPEVLLDGAHNPAAARALADYLASENLEPVLLFACMQDKDIPGLLSPILPHCKEAVFTSVEDPRAARPADLLSHAGRVLASTAAPVEKALRIARARAEAHNSPLLVCGSLYLLGEIVPLLDGPK